MKRPCHIPSSMSNPYNLANLYSSTPPNTQLCILPQENNPSQQSLFNFLLGQKKKTSLFPVAGLKIAMRNAFFFFFNNSWKSNAQCGFYFFKQNFRKKIYQNNSLGFFSTFIKNITSFISKWFMWPFILHALGASLMNFLPWPKLHHIWKKIQSKCTECM